MPMSLSRLERAEQLVDVKHGAPALTVKDHNIHFGDGSMPYISLPTARKFHEDNSLVRLLMGPYRSGKSVGCCAEVIMSACAMPRCIDGVRRCKAGIVRNTYGELETTTLRTWLQWYGEIGEVWHHKKPALEYKYSFNDGNGVVELELLFLSLDREEDVKKLKSLEVTFIYVNEFSEIPFVLLSHLIGRTGCYPPPKICKEPYWRGVFVDTNAPNIRHPIKAVFEVEKPEGYAMFKQPPALLKVNGKYEMNPDAENVKNLPENYYIDLIKGATEEFINVYAMGRYGSVFAGKAVFPQYNDSLHSQEHLDIFEDEPIYLRFDFGLTPACLIQQYKDGQVRSIKEFVTSRMGLRQLLENIIVPYLKKNFEKFVIYSNHDPSGSRGMDTDERSCVDVLEEFGIASEAAPTNAIITRIEGANWYLSRLVDGKPAYILDREACPTLREGFQGAYCYKKVNLVGEEKYRDMPDKNEYSHIHDCNQYGCCDFRGADLAAQNDDDEFDAYEAMQFDEDTRNKTTGY